MTTRSIRLRRIVLDRFSEQGGRCYYCERATWHPALEIESDAVERLDLFGFYRLALQGRMATIEHLKRLAEGGTDYAPNLVMACRECNMDRGERSVLAHVKAMRQKHQRWPDGLLPGAQGDIRESAVVLQFARVLHG